jgi:uncharacterized protein YaiE (UPF0345 family)
VGLEWGPLSLMSITEELLEWKSSGSGPRFTVVGSVALTTRHHLSASTLKLMAYYVVKCQAVVIIEQNNYPATVGIIVQGNGLHENVCTYFSYTGISIKI